MNIERKVKKVIRKNIDYMGGERLSMQYLHICTCGTFAIIYKNRQWLLRKIVDYIDNNIYTLLLYHIREVGKYTGGKDGKVNE